MMHRACVSGSIGRRDRISAKRRGATGWPCSQGLLATMALIATLGALSGCGSGQTDSGQANSVPVSLSISMPQKSAPMASASTIGSRLWATLQSWLPTLAEAWAATTTDLSTLTVQVTGPGIPSPITETKVLSAPASGQVITFDLNIPVGLNRVFTVSGIDATKRKIFEGQSSPLTLTAGQAASVDITLTGAGVSEAGVLTDARGSHTATLLPSGQVLVVGGDGPIGEGSAPLASVELFNPAANTWTSRASLTDARGFHTATRLLSGQVLVVGGGERFTGTLASAELFEPAANKWTKLATGLTDARGSHTATLLQNGQVLVVGGFGASVVLDSAELLDLSLL